MSDFVRFQLLLLEAGIKFDIEKFDDSSCAITFRSSQSAKLFHSKLWIEFRFDSNGKMTDEVSVIDLG